MIRTLFPILALTSSIPLHAASVVHYDFEGELETPSSQVPGIFTGGALLPNIGAGLSRHIFHSPLTDPAWGEYTSYFRATAETVTKASALENDAYFTITVHTHTAQSLESLAMNLAVSVTDGPYGLFVRSSLTGTTDLFDTVVNTDSTALRYETLDLTAWDEFSDVSGDVTFQFYLYGTAGHTNRNLLVDNISFTAVPEPGSLLLTASAGLLALRRRRR